MKQKLLMLSALIITALTISVYPLINKGQTSDPLAGNPVPVPPSSDEGFPILPDNRSHQPVIQLAILLDTSGSMDGLIDQARNQLWQVVNEFATSRKNGLTPRLEVAVYEYGNDGLPKTSGYIRQVTPLTTELDQVSEALFSLTTNGGSEYCGFAINQAVIDLKWSQSSGDIRTIFIAGNEPFTQGPINYTHAIALARDIGITVNTIHAGGYQDGATSGWRKAALLAGGDYMNIDHDHRIAHAIAPQDQRIGELNSALNNTYVPYGDTGIEKHHRQKLEDQKSMEISEGLMAKRAISKTSSMYDNRSWDLVDAVENNAVQLDTLTPEVLPEEMQNLDTSERISYIKNKAAERQRIRHEITQLSQERKRWVADQQASEPDVNTIDEAIISAVRKQGHAKQYQFEDVNP